MRIRKSASRLLGSAYGAAAATPQSGILTPPPPPPCLAPSPALLESRGGVGFSSAETASGEACELSRSPWDLLAELSLSDDPQVEDDIVDTYFVHVKTRASWLFSASMPVSSSNSKKMAEAAVARARAKRRREAAKKLQNQNKAAGSKKDSEAPNKAKVKKEEEEEVPARVWKCKKNDGRRWYCHRTVSQPNTLCNYHFVQKRSYLNPDFEFDGAVEPEEAPPAPAPAPAPAAAAATSKPTSNSKPRKKRRPSSDFNATEGLYYYAGFGPFRSKRHSRSGGTNEPVPAKLEEVEEVPEDASPPAADQAQTNEETNRAAPRDDVSSCDDDIEGIAGVDEDSSDDDYDGIGIAGGSGDPQANNGNSKRKTPWKRWRKPVKARSLKSLM